MNDKIIIKGASENNLKNISLEIPKNKLIVITGLSGSGKSSLAFDTIYAEGQRRYLQSLSTYARQFLSKNEKPNVESIEGLSPSIAIDQKSTGHNPRSTVGTITEIYDHLRVLFARVGKPICPKGHGPIQTQTLKQIVDNIFQLPEDEKIILLSPISLFEKGSLENTINSLKKEGFLRIRINGEIFSLDEEINLKNSEIKTIEIVIDRIVLNHDQETRSRLNDSVEIGLKEGKGKVILKKENEEILYSESFSCKKCNFIIPELEPRLFSFNSPIGACFKCKGLGYTIEPSIDKIIPDKSLSIIEGAIDFFKNANSALGIDSQKTLALMEHHNIDKNKAIKDLSKLELDYILYGTDEKINFTLHSSSGSKYEIVQSIEGVVNLIKRRHMETNSDVSRQYYSKYMTEAKCNKCLGKKLSKESLAVKIDNKDIIELTNYTIDSLIEFLNQIKLSESEEIISKPLLKEILERLNFLNDVGLNYLTLSRTSMTLSGGESQRIRLATQIGSHLTGVLYVLDEPSIGLHQKDNDRLIETLKYLRDLGNTLIVVEHDEETMMKADYLIDIGPGAGNNGGEVTAAGTVQEVMNNPNSLTGKYLSGELFIPVPKSRRSGNGKRIELKGAKGNNLKNVDLSIPLNKLIAVTGVSGSGKSSLILDTFVKAIQKNNFDPFVEPLPYNHILGSENIDKIVIVDQSPIGRTPRSNPATYVSVFDDIRDIFSAVPEAREKGYTKSRFSFNVKGGRCENCQGDGVLRIAMHFLPDVFIQCSECEGKKYNEETLLVKYKGKSIFDILSMSVEEALLFFENIPSVFMKLKLMNDVGLGYLKLGSQATTLSGGEAQRIKLSKFLQKRPTGKTIYVLDEPTTGLHTADVEKLLKILQRIVNNGDTVLVVEHNLDLIKCADHIIDVGPGGGINGGEIIATGTPEQVINNKNSITAKYLKEKILK
jgi:excinuclease ABC subunit A